MSQSDASATAPGSPFGRIRTVFRPDQLIPGLIAGLIIGITEIALAASFAALIFAGEMEPYLSVGIGVALFSGMVSLGIIALLSSEPVMIGGNQDVPAAILATIAGAIVGASTAASGVTFVTVLAAVAVTTLITGVALVMLGVFKLARFVRFLPYPVAGGFLAGTGWLIFAGGIGLMAGEPFSLATLPTLLQGPVLIRWLPGLLYGIVILVLSRRVRHYLFMPAMIIAGALLFFLIAGIFGVTPAELSAQGWLLGPLPAQGLWPPALPAPLTSIEWPLIVQQTPNIVATVVISAIALLLNATALEVELRRDVDVNRDMRAAGWANVAASFGGGMVGYQQVGMTALNARLGISTRLTGFVAAAVCAFAMFVGGALLGYFPEAVFGALLVYLGLSFLWEWLVEAWRKLPRIDYAIVVAILVVIVTIGFLEGVLLGTVAAIVMFVVNYSRTDIVKHSVSIANYRSRVTRPPHQREILDRYGHRAQILQLQGFLFFGTAHNLLVRTRAWVSSVQEDHPRYLLLDFGGVSGLDTTALLSFTKIRQLAETSDLTLCITAFSPAVGQQLRNGGFIGDDSVVRVFDSLDRALEWMEERILIDADCPVFEATSLRGQLLGLADPASHERAIDSLLGYLDRQELDAGAVLIRQGDPPDAMYFVESGLITAQIMRANGEILRLETMMGSRVVGELGFYLSKPRSADVVADESSVVYRLTREALERMEVGHPEAASLMHQLIARLLSERVTHLAATVEALQR